MPTGNTSGDAVAMKAIVIHEYGPPRSQAGRAIRNRARRIRIRIHAATVNRVLDVSLRAGKEAYRGPVPPYPPSTAPHRETRSGRSVTRWKAGQRVAAAGVMPLDPCPEIARAMTGRKA